MTTGQDAKAAAAEADDASDATGVDVTAWRGVAAEGSDEVSAETGVRLRERSRRLLRSLLRPHKRLFGYAVVLLLLQNAAGLAGPYLVSVGIDAGIPPIVRDGDATLLVTVVVVFALASAVEYGTKRSFLVASGRIGQAVLLDLRRRVYDHFQRLSTAFHERYTSGRVISRLTSDVDAMGELVDGGLDDLVIAGLNVVSIGAVLLILDWRLALIVLAGFPLLWWLSTWYRHRSAVAYRRTRETIALVIVHFVESLGGIRAVQAFRREPRNTALFEAISDDHRRATRYTNRLVALFSPGIQLIGNVTTALVLTVGGAYAVGGSLQIGVLAAFLLYLRRFFEPMQELSMFYNALQSATAGLEKLSGVLEEPPSVPEPVTPTPLSAVAGAVRFEGVRFSYRADRPVLPALDLDIPAGQTLALVGATGAGKTTVARLFARFYDPLDGRVTLDGVDLREICEADLRRAVVMITQENFLFTGSVADNIAFGRPAASRNDVEAAAAAIGADGFVRALPHGYDTDVAKRGGRLSAGQRQLVAFARAFLADPAVLVLDEATSSLDIPSERAVQRALRTILADRTALIIAHRLSTVEIADRVLVLDGGRVVEDGSPTELIAAGGRYAGLHHQWADSLV